MDFGSGDSIDMRLNKKFKTLKEWLICWVLGSTKEIVPSNWPAITSLFRIATVDM